MVVKLLEKYVDIDGTYKYTFLQFIDKESAEELCKHNKNYSYEWLEEVNTDENI